MINRIIKNWKTTIAAVIPAIAVVGAKLGFDVDIRDSGIIAGAIYAILLLLAKDRPVK